MKTAWMSLTTSPSIAFLLLVFGAGTFVTGQATAQIKPAYTKDVDERGRTPYNLSVGFSASGCSVNANCTNFFTATSTIIGSPLVMVFDAPAVPAGKRLIVEWVSADLPASSNVNSISFQSSTILSNQNAIWQYHGPFFSTVSGLASGMSSGAFFTVEPGESPHLRVVVGMVSNAGSLSITIGGYLIDATN